MTGEAVRHSQRSSCEKFEVKGLYSFVFNNFAYIDGGLGILSEVPLLLEKEALSAFPTQICTQTHPFEINRGQKSEHH